MFRNIYGTMAQIDLRRKLSVLADAAKYDASCASSGTSKRDSVGGRGIGSTEGMGICHACLTPLRSGQVTDLRSGEVHGEPGELIQTCVSAAAGPLSLDL